MKNQTMLCLFLLLVAWNLSLTQTTCPNRALIDQLLTDAHIPGAVILVMNNTDIVYQHSFGYHSLTSSRSMDVDQSIFALASVSKTFIAVAIMQLVESNVLDLDQDINQYLSDPIQRIYHPSFPSHKITLRQLLSHSASINRNDQMEGVFVKLGDAALTPTGLTEACYTYLHPNASNWLPHPPGTVTLYSNIGSALAALVVERVTRLPYERYVRERILQPLGIDIGRAAFRLSDLNNQDDLVQHYTYNASRLEFLNQIFPQLNLTQVKSIDEACSPERNRSFLLRLG